MQAPIVIFDHVKKVVTVVQQGPAYDKNVEEALTALRGQVTTASGTSAR
jgi:hypothetical protein